MRALVELDPTSSLIRYVPSFVGWKGIPEHRKAGDEGILAVGWGSGIASFPYLVSVSTFVVIELWQSSIVTICYLTALRNHPATCGERSHEFLLDIQRL